MPHFEIGMVYRKNSRLHLAVDHTTLITVAQGRFQEVRPYVKYEALRHISVEELCLRWRVSVEMMDKATSLYLAPPPKKRLGHPIVAAPALTKADEQEDSNAGARPEHNTLRRAQATSVAQAS
jgi:hypothetical protein